MAFKLAEAYVDIVGKTNGVEGTLDGLKSRLGKTVDAFSNAATQIGSAMTKVGAAITAGSGFALKLGMDAVESENLFEVSFGKMATAARRWSEEFSKSVGLNAYEVRKMSGTLYVMLNSMGLTNDKAYEMSTAMTKLAYDMASFYNLSPEEAFEKLQAGITGEAEPLKRLGIILLDTQLKQQALKMGLDGNTQAMDEATKVAVRFAAIMDQTSKAQGDMARTMDSPTNQLRAMKSQMTQVGIEIGKTLIPAFQELLTKVQPLIPKIQEFAAAHGELIVNVSMLGAAMMVAGPALMAIGPGVAVIKSLGVALGSVAGMVGGWPVLLGAAVVAGVGVLTNWDSIKAWADEKWPQIGLQIKATWNGLRSHYPIIDEMSKKFVESTTGIRAQIAAWWTDHQRYFGPIWDQLKKFGTFCKETLASDWKTAWAGVIGPTLKAVLDGALAHLGALIKFLGGDFKGAWLELEKFWYALFDRMSAKLTRIVENMKALLQGLIDSVKNAMGMDGAHGNALLGPATQQKLQSGQVNVGGVTVNGAANPQATAKAVVQAIVDAQKYGVNAGMLAAMP